MATSTTQNPISIGVILPSIDNVNQNNLVIDQILADYSDYNIYFYTKDGLYSPTLNLKNSISSTMNNHMNSYNQHKIATETQNGFMSSEDRVKLNMLYTLEDVVLEHPLAQNYTNTLLYANGLLSTPTYTIKDNQFIFSEFNIMYQGYIVNVPSVSLTILPKPESNFRQDYIYVKVTSNIEGLSIGDFSTSVNMIEGDEGVEIDIDSLYDPDSDEIPLYIINRPNSEQLSVDNPYGSPDPSVLVEDYNVFSAYNITLLNNFNLSSVLKTVGNNILNGEYYNPIYKLEPIYYGIPSHTTDSNTLVHIEMDTSECIDTISGVSLDKNEVLTLSPNGLALYESSSVGSHISLPSKLANQFIIDFNIIFNSGSDDLVFLCNNKYIPLVFISTRDNYLFINNEKLNYEFNDDTFYIISLLYNDGVFYLYERNNLLTQLEFNISTDINNISQFALPALSTVISDIRLENGDVLDNVFGKDILINKALLYPPINIGYKNICNGNKNTLMTFQLTNTSNWTTNDSFIIKKNLNDYINGIYNSSNALTSIIGINSNFDIIVQDSSNLDVGQNIKISNSKGLLETFIIEEIDGNVITLSQTNESNGYNFNYSYIGAYIYNSLQIPNLLIVDGDGVSIESTQYVDENGNIEIKLESNSNSKVLNLSYILSTSYGEVLPDINLENINTVTINNIPYVLDNSYSSITVDTSSVSISPNMTKSGNIYYVSSTSDETYTISIPLTNGLSSNNIDSINLGVNIYASNNVTISCDDYQTLSYISEDNIMSPLTLNMYNVNSCLVDDNICFTLEIPKDTNLCLEITSIKVNLNIPQNSNIYIPYDNKTPSIDDVVFISSDSIETNVINTSKLNIKLYTTTNVNKNISTAENLTYLINAIELNDNYNASLAIDSNDNAYIEIADNISSTLYRMPDRLVLKGGDYLDSLI